jgi:Fe-S-cluster containining protein
VSPFYGEGLRFSCARCSRCCRHEPGYVFLSRRDLVALAAATGLEEPELLRRYCTRVQIGELPRLSLREKPNYDCIFWENGGCTVYEARPLQCRSYPFWASNVDSEESWERTARDCPGIGQGRLHSRREIEQWLDLRLLEGYLEGAV